MKIEKDIRVEMVRMEGDVAPFVQVDYMDKDAQDHTGLMLLDSGSTVNVLSSEMAEHDWVLDFGKQEVLIPDTDVSVEEFRKLNK